MIGYYVHHCGDGHVTRAASIAARFGAAHVTGLSSLPRPGGWEGGWIELARDDDEAAMEAAEPTAGGTLHWAPLHHPGLRERMGRIAAWVRDAAPALVVVDVSVEVAVAVRAMGVPVVVIGMPGDRRDAAHQLAYRLADAIIAPWPAWADPLDGGAAWRAKTHPVGAISRFDDRPPVTVLPSLDGRRRALVLSGRGGTGLTAEMLAAAEAATPGWAWTVIGPPGDRWAADPWPLLHDADVVITHAGQNAIAEIAAARRPAVVIAQARPHDEQRAMAETLRASDLAIVPQAWPAAGEWPDLLARAARREGGRWARWNDRSGASRAAAVLDRLATVKGRVCAPR